MSAQLTNLLPPSKTKALRQEYFMRVATVGILILVVLVFVQCVFLLPLYAYERNLETSDSAKLAQLSLHPATAADQQVATSLSSVQQDSTFLLSLASTPKASTALRAVLAVPHLGITLTGFTYTPPASGTSATLQLSGTAATRDDLRSYDAALGALSYVTTASLPVSAYSSDSAIPFTITLSGTLTP